MKFGICCPASFISEAAAIGFDYVELGVSTALLPETISDEHISNLKQALEQSNVASETLNFMLPGGFHCVGFDVDEYRLARYFEAALPRAAAVGAKALVFGSGTQRTIPEGLPYHKGYEQYKFALELAGRQAAKYGIVIAIEPLNHTESNLVNSVKDGIKLATEIDLPSVKVLSDLYHVETDHQPYSETTEAGKSLAHVHIAGYLRRAPVADDLPVLTEYFKAVKAAGYDDRISIEAVWQDISSQAAEALGVTKAAWVAS